MSDEQNPITIPMENEDGSPAAMPTDLQMPAETSAETPPAEPETPAEPAPQEPSVNGLKAALGKERAEKAELKKFREQVMPIVEALKQRPDVVAMLERPIANVPAPGPSASDEKLTKLASTLVLYKPDGSGQPDVEAARTFYNEMVAMARAEAAAAVDERVAPIRQSVQQRDANDHRAHIMAMAKESHVEDVPELAQVLDGFAASNPAMLADPAIQSAALAIARGLKGFREDAARTAPPAVPAVPAVPAPITAANGAPPAVPAFTERSGGRAPAAPPVAFTPLEERMAKSRNMTAEAWTAAVSPLVNNPLGNRHITFPGEE